MDLSQINIDTRTADVQLIPCDMGISLTEAKEVDIYTLIVGF
jgi:hypothetical protein